MLEARVQIQRTCITVDAKELEPVLGISHNEGAMAKKITGRV